MFSHPAQEGTRWAHSGDHDWCPLHYLQWCHALPGPKKGKAMALTQSEHFHLSVSDIQSKLK